MTDSEETPGSTTQAQQAFGEYVARLENDPSADFEVFCQERPDLEDELRRLYATIQAVSGQLQGASEAFSFAKRLGMLHGEDANPDVSLKSDEGETSDPSSEVLERLGAHAPAQTRYRLVGELGRGGMGVILKAWDEDLRRNLAMKVILGKGEDTSTSLDFHGTTSA
ncbi:MAG: hypothetical protein KJ749_15260 [Planctomycetes bacterium]|nr:hypothetical protein [Planctomycetota bacterium]